MKKKLLIVFLAITATLCCAFGFAACNSESKKARQIEIGYSKSQVEELLGKPDEEKSYKWEYFGGEYSKLNKEAEELEKKMESITNERELEKFLKQLDELEEKMSALEFPYTCIDFDNDGKVKSVVYNAKYNKENAYDEKEVEKVTLTGNTVTMYTSLRSSGVYAKITYKDGSYRNYQLEYANNFNSSVKGETIIEWSDDWGTYREYITVTDLIRKNQTIQGTIGKTSFTATALATGSIPEVDFSAVISGTPSSLILADEDSTWSSIKKCLTEISIPDSVTEIGDYVFSGCKKLTSISIPDKVTAIGPSAFGGCVKLTGITLPDKLTAIGENAFDGCTGITDIHIPAEVTEIGDAAFGGCKLEKITVDTDNIKFYSEGNCLIEKKTNGNLLIVGCNNSAIPDSVTEIGKRSFEGCTGITSLKIPATVRTIDISAFYGCNGIENITVDPNNANYYSENNCLIRKMRTQNYLVLGCKNSVIPNGVTRISDDAFAGCTGLTTVTVPDSVTYIGTGAFSGCIGLKSIKLPNSITQICKATFRDCSSLESISIPDSVKEISEYAFFGCTSLKSFTIPHGISTIWNNTFENCTGLKEIVIPDSVTGIGRYAFSGCTGLTSVTIPDNIKYLEQGIFSYCTGLKSIKFPNSMNEIPDSMFSNCSSLESIVIPNGVNEISQYAFFGCTALTNITIPETVTYIGMQALDNCDNINITFKGTKAQWNEISCNSGFSKEEIIIHCSDGDIIVKQ